jgi:hypothetical protein
MGCLVGRGCCLTTDYLRPRHAVSRDPAGHHDLALGEWRKETSGSSTRRSMVWRETSRVTSRSAPPLRRHRWQLTPDTENIEETASGKFVEGIYAFWPSPKRPHEVACLSTV